MSERILKALMQLFAIVARVDNNSDDGRTIVQSFLRQQLNQELAEQYLLIFDEFLTSHHQVKQRKDGSAKRTSLNSVKVLKICDQINNELTQVQKIVVLIRLIEFINSNEIISEQEHDFVSTVQESFNISSTEFDTITYFVNEKDSSLLNPSYTLIVSGEKTNKYSKFKRVFAEGLSGEVRVLWVPSVNIYALIYLGDSELYLNGHFVSKGKIYILTPGSSFRSSKIKPVYYSDILSTFLSDDSKPKISFTVKELEYKFKGGKIGLRDINFSEDSGKLIGIMGGSGAGKSTLLNVLNGNENPSGGSVKINGINVHAQKHKLEGVIGHVSQDDLLIEELTVFQNLFYNAKLCFGNKTDEEITAMVIKLLSDLGLHDSKDLIVGSPLKKTISGGQRKRLNIALELIREPSVLFVDEPTSGLSSRDSENIMDLLKELALKGKLVFVVIHQPSSDIFKMFDRLLILDVGGYPIYYGNPVDAVIYFKTLVNHVNSDESACIECGNVNPEQIFNIIESKVVDEYGNTTRNRKVTPVEWNSHYKEKLENSRNHIADTISEIPASILKIPNKINQFKIFITRDVLSKLTNQQYLLINLLEAPALAFVLSYFVKYYNADISNQAGYIFRENENLPVYMFMAVIVPLFIGLTVSAEEIIRDRKILKRESFLNLSRGSYLASKIMVMFMWSAIQTFLFVLIGNYVLEIRGMGFSYWLILFSTSCFANMLGLNISASFNSVVTIYILIPFLIIPQLLLSGVIVKFDKLNPIVTSQNHVPLIGEVMTSRWAFEALAVKQFKDNDSYKDLYAYDKEINTATYKKDYWLNEIQKKLDYCIQHYQAADHKSKVEIELSIIKNELIKELKRYNDAQEMLDFMNGLSVSMFNESDASSIQHIITNLNKQYLKRFTKFRKEKDAKIAELTSTEERKAAYIDKKDKCENESISDLVTNKNGLQKITEINGELVQKSNPVFHDPDGSTIGRAHFFAPRKKIMNIYMDAYWFNIIVIWLMSLSLTFALYFDMFRKFLEIAGRYIILMMRLKNNILFTHEKSQT